MGKADGRGWGGVGSPAATRYGLVLIKCPHFFSGDPSRVSVMFDAMQSNDRSDTDHIRMENCSFGIQYHIEYFIVFKRPAKKLDNFIDVVLSKPSEIVDRPLWFKYTELDVQRLVDRFDIDGDGKVTRYEVSRAMRSMDNNNDNAVRRCYFIDVMTSYRQHGAAASNFYDFLFSQRDVTWADVDSDFFLATADDNGDRTVTRKELVDFFNVRNKLASGHWVDAARETTGNSASSFVIHSCVPLMVAFIQSIL
ncbi:hypothetical protein Btru_070169 [Bulinus truncatus]|nr:hypothetical protein Btru_070169 [Bulinus truncatus]